MNSLRTARREARVEGDHDQLSHPQRRDQLGLHREARQQLRRVLRCDDRNRVRIEGQHAVGTADHLAVTEVHTVEGADRHAASLPGLDVGQASDLHRPQAYGFADTSARTAGRRACAPPAPARARVPGAVRRAPARSGSACPAAAPTARRDWAAPVRPRPRTARSRCAAALRSTRRRGPRSASARRCPRSTRSGRQRARRSSSARARAARSDRPSRSARASRNARRAERADRRAPLRSSRPSRSAGAGAALPSATAVDRAAAGR